MSQDYLNQANALEKLQQEIAYALDKVPFYRSHYEGFAASDIRTEEDIARLPTTEKRHFRVNFPKGVLADGVSSTDTGLFRSQSSGTTGERLITLEHGMLWLDRAMKCAMVNPPVMMAWLTPQKKVVRYAAPNCSDVECANPNSGLTDRLLHDGTLVLPVYHDLLTTTEVLINRALDEIKEYQPDVYYMDPTHFAFLLRQPVAQQQVLPAVPVLTTYSAMTHIARRDISRAFPNSPVVELAAMSELGWIGMTCPHGRMHINNASFYLELLDGDRPVAPGERGELVVSSLDQGISPHIRYRTGDLYRATGEVCSCGNPMPVVEMDGRHSSFIVLPDGRELSPRMIDNAIQAPGWLSLYQVQQREGELVFRFIANEQYQPGDEQSVITELQQLTGVDSGVHVRGESVNYLSTERSGKFQYCQPLAQPTFSTANHEDAL